MQFQVPQFIETEDKIVGPFSLRQFLYVAAAGMISLFFYFTLTPTLWIFASVILLGGALALAFYKYNGQSLPQLIAAALSFFWQPRMFVWQPENPSLPKNESTIKSALGEGFDIEKLVSGISLKKAFQFVQTGARGADEAARPAGGRERFQVIRKLTGERQVARRVDYM